MEEKSLVERTALRAFYNLFRLIQSDQMFTVLLLNKHGGHKLNTSAQSFTRSSSFLPANTDGAERRLSVSLSGCPHTLCRSRPTSRELPATHTLPTRVTTIGMMEVKRWRTFVLIAARWKPTRSETHTRQTGRAGHGMILSLRATRPGWNVPVHHVRRWTQPSRPAWTWCPRDASQSRCDVPERGENRRECLVRGIVLGHQNQTQTVRLTRTFVSNYKNVLLLWAFTIMTLIDQEKTLLYFSENNFNSLTISE